MESYNTYVSGYLVFLRFILCSMCQKCNSFSRLNNNPLNGYTTFCLSIHVSVDIWVVSTFWLLWLMVLWTGVGYLYSICSQVPAFSSLGYMLRSGIAGSYGNSMFNFLQNHHTVYPQWLHHFISHQQCTRVPISPHSHQHLFSFSFFLFL